MSNTSGACTGMVGCRHEGRLPGAKAHARDSLARRCRSDAAAPCGRCRQPHSAIPSNPDTFTCIRSSDESTLRTVPPPTGFFSEHVPRLKRLPQFQLHTLRRQWTRSSGNRNSRCGANHSRSNCIAEPLQEREHLVEILLDEMRQQKRSCSAVPQRTSLPSIRLSSRTRPPAPESAAARPSPSGHAEPFRRRAVPAGPAANRILPADTACRCRTRRDACCPSYRPADCGTGDPPARAGTRLRATG